MIKYDSLNPTNLGRNKVFLRHKRKGSSHVLEEPSGTWKAGRSALTQHSIALGLVSSSQRLSPQDNLLGCGLQHHFYN